jgi:hypothetical protein
VRGLLPGVCESAINARACGRQITPGCAQEVAAADATHAQYRHLRALRNATVSAELPALTRLWSPRRCLHAAPPRLPPAGDRPAAAPPGAGAEKVLQAYTRLTTRAGDQLARRAGQIKAALHRLSPASVWFTRQVSPSQPSLIRGFLGQDCKFIARHYLYC